MISLYIHIPFCTRKCDYCHFFVLPDKMPLKLQLMEGLEKEWLYRLPQVEGKQIASIYFGGGTPALLGPAYIQKILSWIPGCAPDVEITLEANPENINYDLMHGYAEAGINRVSIGIQSLDDSLLAKLGRQHSAQKAIDAVHTTSKARIHNISVDLMYDLPGQTLEHWKNTLCRIKDLPLTHLSLYNLTIEPHTVFFKQRTELKKILPDEEASLEMYKIAVETLEHAGLDQYEISAFAKNGFQSRHNVGYWTARPFLGFGPSAFSYWERRRFRNVAHLGKYEKALAAGDFPVDFEEELAPADHRRELLAVRLRLREGVQLDSFQSSHGTLEERDWAALQKLQSEGLISINEATIKLTERGVLFYDTVAVDII